MKRLVLVLALTLGAVLAPAASAQAVRFQSPSKNIGCYLSKAFVRCDVDKRSWDPPPKPRWCERDFGQGLYVERRGRGRFVCANDSALGTGRVLGYGESRRRGRYRCRSRTSGMRCVNTRTDHGFFISRQRARRF